MKENILAERVVQVTIRASVDKYITGMERARKATAAAASESEKLERVGQAAEKVGTAMGVMGAASVAAVGYMVKVAADFDAQMSKVQAATAATASEMAKFRNQALTAGAAFGYTASQVTEAQIELGKAGLATKDILGGALQGTLALAASDNIDLGKATQIAAVAMKQFKLEGQDVPHIADLLAAGAGKALGGVEELGDALNQSGLVASNFGFSLEETTGVLSAFADQGLLGSDAGTSLKTMLQALANPSKESAQLMKSLGINVQDANGQFLGAAELSQQLHDKLNTLSDAQHQQALAQIFGSDATRAATVLMKEAGDGIQKYINQNNDAGYAMEQARIKSDNLNGDLKKLQSAFQTGLIQSGSTANGALRPLVQTATGLVQAFNDLPEPIKAAGVGLTAAAGGASLLGGGMLYAIPKIVEFRSALATLREAGFNGRGALGSVSSFLTGPWALGIGAGVAGVALLNLELDKLKATSAEVGNSLVTAKRAVDIYSTLGKGQVWSPATAKITDQFKDLDRVLSDFAQHNSGNFFEAIGSRFANSDTFAAARALRELNEELGTLQRADPARASEAFKLLAKDTDGSATSIHRLVDAIGGDYRNALVEQANAMGITASDTHLAQLAMGQYTEAAKGAKDPAAAVAAVTGDVADSAEDAAQKVSDLVQSIKGLTSNQLDVNSSQRDFEAALDAVTSSIKDNGKSMDVTTDKGRSNAAALDQIAQSTLNYAGALYQQTGSQDTATAALQKGRDSLVAALGQYGVTGQAAQDYATKILGTPTDWATLFQADTADAAGKTDELTRKIGRVPSQKETKLRGEISDAKAKLKELQDKLASVPKSKSTKLNAEVAAAKANLSSLQAQLNTLQSKTITVTTVNNNLVADGSKGKGLGVMKAAGGFVSGPGTGTSDSIPAYLSNGEYVIRQRSVAKYGTGFLDAVNAGRYANGGLVARFAAGGSVADALQRLSGVYGFRSSVRNGSLTGTSAVSQALQLATDVSVPARLRATIGRVAEQTDAALVSLEKRSTSAAAAVDKASSKLDGLKSSASSMSSSLQSKLGDVSVGDYRSATSLQSGLTKRAGKLKEFQALLNTLQKNGVAPALLNEIASLGVDAGMPLARSLAATSKSQIKAINSQYNAAQSTATKIGDKVADANFGKLITAAEKQLRSANSNASKITKAIDSNSRKLQRLIGKALGVPGYQVGGYTGDGGAGEVAGLVHGREFVVNQAATARNRALLEAMNSGATVRYMDPTPLRAAAQPQQVIHRAGNNYNLSVQDPTAVAHAIERRERSQYA